MFSQCKTANFLSRWQEIVLKQAQIKSEFQTPVFLSRVQKRYTILKKHKCVFIGKL